jgi:hypothetical protein
MSSASQVRWTGWLRSADRPSIVVISEPVASLTGIAHERTACPPT